MSIMPSIDCSKIARRHSNWFCRSSVRALTCKRNEVTQPMATTRALPIPMRTDSDRCAVHHEGARSTWTSSGARGRIEKPPGLKSGSLSITQMPANLRRLPSRSPRLADCNLNAAHREWFGQTDFDADRAKCVRAARERNQGQCGPVQSADAKLRGHGVRGGPATRVGRSRAVIGADRPTTSC